MASYEQKIERIEPIFEKYVIKKDNDQCWEWSGPTFHAGYGQMWFDLKTMNASRVSWLIHNGPIENNLWVLHKCDNPVCTNPNHLYLGTCKDNVQDMIKKGRRNIAYGSQRSHSKLCENIVKEIKSLLLGGVLLSNLATKYKVSISAISAIKTGRIWKHVT